MFIAALLITAKTQNQSKYSSVYKDNETVVKANEIPSHEKPWVDFLYKQ